MMINGLSDIITTIRSYLSRRKTERESRRIEQAEAERKKEFLYELGNRFEDHAITLFDPEAFELIHRTPTNEETGGRYVSSMVYPDLRFKEKSTGRKFWVECKYRAHVGEHWKVEWCTDTQLRHYKRTMHESGPVFILLGLGGTVDDPELLYLLNLEQINFTTLFYGTYKPHRVYRTFQSFDEIKSIADKTARSR